MINVDPPQGPLKRSLADAIRSLIADGTLGLGARISDKALAAELGVSRTPVREALLALVGEGLVTVRPQSGSFVFRPDADEIAALCAFRSLLETGAVRLAPGPDTLAATLAGLCDGADAALTVGDLAACETADTAFHGAIVTASANPDLIGAHRGIAARVRALRHTLPATRGRIAAANAAHRAIASALASGERERAAALLAAHVEGVARLLGAPPIRTP
ncbi:GntR family transcriptional regulator [Elioraea sp.]|uniref:GntR family transcriptional regulator n=1 Tax=Elioraea sp. TaxID=2185103 RepID=UPI0025BCA779|nr:GntR family transcriptional regulator [Elioraea sp.]